MNRCEMCGARIAWARTAASETGTGGKPMPLDAEPNPLGNVAVRKIAPPGRRRFLVARVLGKDETHDTYAEQLYMPHFATCAGTARNLGAEAEEFLRTQGDGS